MNTRQSEDQGMHPDHTYSQTPITSHQTMRPVPVSFSPPFNPQEAYLQPVQKELLTGLPQLCDAFYQGQDLTNSRSVSRPCGEDLKKDNSGFYEVNREKEEVNRGYSKEEVNQGYNERQKVNQGYSEEKVNRGYSGEKVNRGNNGREENNTGFNGREEVNQGYIGDKIYQGHSVEEVSRAYSAPGEFNFGLRYGNYFWCCAEDWQTNTGPLQKQAIMDSNVAEEDKKNGGDDADDKEIGMDEDIGNSGGCGHCGESEDGKEDEDGGEGVDDAGSITGEERNIRWLEDREKEGDCVYALEMKNRRKTKRKRNSERLIRKEKMRTFEQAKAFQKLKMVLPIHPKDTLRDRGKLSRKDLLEISIKYIKFLENVIDMQENNKI